MGQVGQTGNKARSQESSEVKSRKRESGAEAGSKTVFSLKSLMSDIFLLFPFLSLFIKLLCCILKGAVPDCPSSGTSQFSCCVKGTGGCSKTLERHTGSIGSHPSYSISIYTVHKTVVNAQQSLSSLH